MISPWILLVSLAQAAPTVHDIVVEPVALTEAAGSLSAAVNVGAVVSDSLYAEGLQEAADIWGLNLDLFVTAVPAERKRLANRLLDAGEYAVILDRMSGENWDEFRQRAGHLMTQCRLVDPVTAKPGPDRIRAGYEELRATRAGIVGRLPKCTDPGCVVHVC